MTDQTDKPITPRTVLITTGLRPVPMAFADFPGTPAGVIVWDSVSAFPGRFSEHIRRVRCLLSGKRYASLKHLCEQHNLHYLECDKRDPAALQNTLKKWDAELVVTSGCAIVPMQALSELRFGGINLHPSKLPDWRGANPLFWQLASEQNEMGVTVHVLSDKIDGGKILAQTTIERPDGLSRQQLTELLEGEIGVSLLKDCIQSMAAGTQKPLVQIASNTPYARRVADKELSEALPLGTLKANTLWNLLRFYGYAPKDWLGITAWRRKLQWAAYKLTPSDAQTQIAAATKQSGISQSDTNPSVGQEDWQIDAKGLKIILTHPSGNITMIPKRLIPMIQLISKITKSRGNRKSGGPSVVSAGR